MRADSQVRNTSAERLRWKKANFRVRRKRVRQCRVGGRYLLFEFFSAVITHIHVKDNRIYSRYIFTYRSLAMRTACGLPTGTHVVVALLFFRQRAVVKCPRRASVLFRRYTIILHESWPCFVTDSVPFCFFSYQLRDPLRRRGTSKINVFENKITAAHTGDGRRYRGRTMCTRKRFFTQHSRPW